MKKFFYMAVAAIAALSSCSSDDAILNEDGQNETGVTTFTATIEGDDATRATYNATTKKAEWVANTDKINVGGAVYTATTTGATTTFTGIESATKGSDEKYHAYFPASLYNGTTASLPATQTYEEGKFNMPMYAESTTTSLEFKNLCAVLAVKVTSADITTLKSIKVKADQKLNGSFTVTDNKAVIGSDGTNVVVLTIAEALTLTTEGTTFYIAIPAQTYQYLNIYLSADGTTYKEAMATKKAGGLGAVARSKMYSIDYEKNAVQLWASGPYFATYNVGVTDSKPESYGGHYYWGGSTARNGNSGSTDQNTGTDALKDDNDTATKLCGRNWRMPKEEELSRLTNSSNCTKTWKTVESVNGYEFKGLSGISYANNSVFLPAAGYYVRGGGSSGFYWSSTPSSSYNANAQCLYFTSNSMNVVDRGRNQSYSVRAVLAEN